MAVATARGALRAAGSPVALALCAAVVLGGCRAAAPTVQAAPAATPPPDEPADTAETMTLGVRLPERALEGFDAGEGRTVALSLTNTGTRPVVVTYILFEGPIRGRRNLLVPDEEEEGAVRAFGTLPPGQSGRFTVGVHAPDAGTGEVRLVVRTLDLPPALSAGAMREVRLPSEVAGTAPHETVLTFDVAVASVELTREAAEARAGLTADEAVRVGPLDAWLLRRGNDTYLVSVREAVPFPGFSPAAAALLDASKDDETVPILDEQGRLAQLPWAIVKMRLEEARLAGAPVDAVNEGGRQVLRVGK